MIRPAIARLLFLVMTLSACSDQIANPAETTIDLPLAPKETVPGACAGVAEPDSVGMAGPDGTFCLRPPSATGAAVIEAGSEAKYGTWSVFPLFAEGSTGIDAFNAMTAECFELSERCPTGQIAVVFDNEVLSAPLIQAQSFERDSIVLAGGLSEIEARRLASALTNPAEADRVGFHFVLAQTG